MCARMVAKDEAMCDLPANIEFFRRATLEVLRGFVLRKGSLKFCRLGQTLPVNKHPDFTSEPCKALSCLHWPG